MPLLANKKIMVAGGSGRIGWPLVKEIVAQGGEVISLDCFYDQQILSEVEAGSALKDNVELVTLDICSESDVTGFFKAVTELDGFVNCSYPRGRNYGRKFLDVCIDDFNDTLAAHLGSAMLLTQECVRLFVNHPRSFSIVNFSSIYGVVAPRFDIYRDTEMTMPVEYALTKAAIQHLSKYVSSYVHDSRFRINTISPGGIRDQQPDSFLKKYSENTFGTGMLNPFDVTGSVIYLISDLSKYVTGQNIIVDDGFHL